MDGRAVWRCPAGRKSAVKHLLILTWTLIASVACSDATIRKVPNRASYDNWNDAKQREVDAMEGVRFYRSRPYVVVHRPFPLRSNSYLVDGVISADGKYVQLTPAASRDGSRGAARLTRDLQHFSAADLGRPGGMLPTSAIWKGLPSRPIPSGRSTSGAEGGAVTVPPFIGAPSREAGADAPTGSGTLALQTNLEAIATRQLGERFELVYLPDFEEEYVVNPRANLGDVNIALAQGPGGVLMAMGMRVDNAAVTRPLVQAYARSVEALGSRLSTALGQDPVDSLVAPSAEGADISAKSEERVGGTLITLRVHVVEMASPGIYPILKASELLDSRNCRRTLTRCRQCAGLRQPCSDCRMGAYGALEGRTGHSLLVPCEYPYSRIAYQTHRVVLVEHLISHPGESRLLGRSQGGAGQGDDRLTVRGAITSLESMRDWLNVRFRRSPKTRCLVAEVLSMTPSSGGSPEEFTEIELTLHKDDDAGSAVPVAQRKACSRAAREVLREALPGVRDPQIGFR